jgi:uncharacterized protein YndB with AHSA1/START domain
MNTAPVQHDTFVIERRLASSPARVFAAFADQRKKARWFGCVDGWEVAEHTMDFQVGGRETWRGGPPVDSPHRIDTYFLDIVPHERFVWSFAMQVGGRRISVSLATLELSPDARGTHMRFIEQGVYLDGHDGLADRERGTKDLLDNLERALREEE